MFLFSSFCLYFSLTAAVEQISIKMKNGSHLEVVASIKDINTDLNREFEVGSEEYNQASRGFCPSKTSNLLRVVHSTYLVMNAR